MISIELTEDDIGVRLDKLLRTRLAHLPLSSIYRLIRTGGAKVNKRKKRGEYRLQQGDALEVAVDQAELTASSKAPQQEQLGALAQTLFFKRNFRVIFEDDALLACDKPSGLVVHPGSGHTTADTLIDLARAHMIESSGSQIEPFLVHRLDRDTSGIILLAKGKQALRLLHTDFRDRSLTKRYMLICHGTPAQPKGTIRLALARGYERNDGTKMQVSDEGAEAITSYSVVKRSGPCSLLEVMLHTGKTHQIRVHLQHIGCPLVGDVRYGDAELDRALLGSQPALRRLYLHALELRFTHPLSHKPIVAHAPLPEPFTTLLDHCARSGS
jgi:RluA family pseudouridine synthase